MVPPGMPGMAPGMAPPAGGAPAPALLSVGGGTGVQVDLAQPHFEADLEINDFGQHPRWKVRFSQQIRRLGLLAPAYTGVECHCCVQCQLSVNCTSPYNEPWSRVVMVALQRHGTSEANTTLPRVQIPIDWHRSYCIMPAEAMAEHYMFLASQEVHSTASISLQLASLPSAHGGAACR